MHEDAATLLASARTARHRLELARHEELVDELEKRHGDDPVVAVAARAERIRDVAYRAHDDDHYRDVVGEVDRLLDATDDAAVRARLLVGRAGCHARLRANGWATAAGDDYVGATNAFLAAGEKDDAAGTAAAQAWSVDLLVHGLRQAATRLAEAIELAESPDKAASFLTQRAKVNVWLGDLDAATDDVARARRLNQEGVLTTTSAAYVRWAEVLVHATRGDEVAVLRALEHVDALLGPWHETVTGVQFETEIADALSRVGLHDTALARLQQATLRAHEDPDAVAVATLAVHARGGDPDAALDAWETVTTSDTTEPWERARATLLAALAADRAGRDADRLAAEAFELAAGHALPTMLLTREPAATESLLDAAVAGGSRAAADLHRRLRGHRVTLLSTPGVQRPDGSVEPLSGRNATLVAVLAASPDGISSELLGQQIWTDGDGDIAQRVRRLLHRVRRIAPIVVRDADGSVSLTTDTITDVAELDDAVTACRATTDGPLHDTTLAHARRLAATTSADELTARPDLPLSLLARVQRQLHWIHRRAAEWEQARGRDDLARTELRAALAHRPDDDVAAAALARSLVGEGRRTDAAEVIRRTATVLTESGVQPSRTFATARDHLLAPDDPSPG